MARQHRRRDEWCRNAARPATGREARLLPIQRIDRPARAALTAFARAVTMAVAGQRVQRDFMAESDKLFAGSIPKLYDTLMVPLIFEAYAVDMARRVAAFSPESVLETAAGSGVVTRGLAPQLRADARY